MNFTGKETQKAVVAVILTDVDGRILLQQRDDKPGLDYPGWWTIFGGYVEDGETPDAAVRRELMEELGIDLPLTHWRTYDCPVRSTPGAAHTRNYVYTAALDRPVDSLTLHEGQGMRLFTPEEAAPLVLAFAQHLILRDYIAEKHRVMLTARNGARGVEAIAEMFKHARSQGRAAFLPYFPIGFPTIEESLQAIEAMAGVDVDGFEIGIPFSDPLADGAVIQAATQIALNNGVTVRKCLRAVQNLRERGVTQPMLLMGYINPMLSYGIDRFVVDAKAAGADGLIVPDLPAEEGDELAEICKREGLALVFFAAPTSSPDRIALAAAKSTGFIYVVSLTGITGERSHLPPDLTDFVHRLREKTGDAPLVMGFGISKPEQARMVGELVNGFIVGSALVRAEMHGHTAVRELAASLRAALNE